MPNKFFRLLNFLKTIQVKNRTSIDFSP